MNKSVAAVLAFVLIAACATIAWFVFAGGPVSNAPGVGGAPAATPEASPEGGGDGTASGGSGSSAETAPRRTRRETAQAAETEGATALAGTVVVPSGTGLAGATVSVHERADSGTADRLTRLRDMAQRRMGGARASTSKDGKDADPAADTAAGMEMGLEMLEDGSLFDLLSGGFDLTGGAFDNEPGRLLGETVTDEKGAFRVDDLPAGSVELRIASKGSVTHKSTETVGTLDLHVLLVPGTGIDGIVVSAGRVVEGALVRTETNSVKTAADGRFRIDGLTSPTARLLVTAPLCVGRGLVVTTDPVPGEPVKIELDPAGAITGRVTGKGGAPVEGATLTVVSNTFNPMSFMALGRQATASDSFPAPAPSARTDADGRFRLDGVAPDTIGVKAVAAGYLAKTVKDVRVIAGETTPGVDFALAQESVLAGRITDDHGAPVANARVRVSVPGETSGFASMIANAMGGQFRSGRSDDSGAYRVDGLVAGERTVKIQAAGFLKQETRLTLPDAGETRHDAALQPGLGLSGVVLTPDGTPAAAAKVVVKWRGDGPANPMLAMIPGADRANSLEVTAGDDGAFRAAGLQEGPYTVTASHPRFLEVSVADVAAEQKGLELRLGAAATLRGTVVAQADGTPVAQAEVHHKGGPGGATRGMPWMAMLGNDPSVTTGADGTFEITGLAAGKVELYGRGEGFADSEHLKLDVAAGAVTEGIVIELPPAVAVRGRVVSSANGSGVEGALVFVPASESPFAAVVPSDMDPTAEPSAPNGAFSARTGPGGAFVIDGLTPGRHSVHVRARGFAAAQAPAADVPGPDVLIELGTGGIVEGVAAKADGTPRPGLQVMLQQGVGARNLMAKTDEDGRYRVENVPPGAYRVMLIDPEAGGMPSMESVTVREGETTVLDFRPQTEGVQPVHGTVERGGKPLAGATVMLTGGSTGMRMGTTDDSGAFLFEGVAPGTYTVVAQASMMGGGSESRQVTVTAETPPSAVRLQLSSLAIRGRVVDAVSGKPVAAALVAVLDPAAKAADSLAALVQGQKGQAFANADGEFSVDGVPDGVFRLRVSAAGYPQTHVENVRPGGDTLVVKLDAGLEFHVKVLDENGDPVAGASVTAEDASGRETTVFDMSLSGLSDESGDASLRLAAGRYLLHVQADGHPEATANVSADRTDLTVQLAAGGTVTVQVRDRDGKPVVGARVEFRDAQDRPIVRRMTFGSALVGGNATDDQGRLERKGFASGTVTVVVTPVDGASVRREATVRGGATTTVDVEIP